MYYHEANAQLQGRCFQSRKLGNNTYLIRDGEQLHVKLHATHILTFYPNGDIRLNTGGWNTVTTRARMNEYLPLPWRVGTDSKTFGYELVLYRAGMPVALADQFTLLESGIIPKEEQEKLAQCCERTREAINRRNRQRSKERYWILKARNKEKAHKLLTLEMIHAEQNVTVRTAMITVYGLERF